MTPLLEMSIRPPLSIRSLSNGLALSIVLFLSPLANANHCDQCGGTGRCTEQVSVTEMRTVTETCYREEQQVKVKLVPRVIKVAKLVPHEYTVMVRVKKEDIQELEIKTPKFRWVETKYTVQVPRKETVMRVRTRVERVPVVKTCKVIEDHGHWQTKMCASDTCGGCLCVEKQVWCANPVEVFQEQTVMENRTIEEFYPSEVTVMGSVAKIRREKEFFTKTTKKIVKNPYMTIEPRQRTKMVTELVSKTIYEEKTEICTARVPYTVTREVPVIVRRSVSHACECKLGLSQ